MASIPITIHGTLTYSDRDIGGGPSPGGQPPQIWGGGGVGNYPDAGFPGPQPGGPVGIWGGGGVGNYPDAGLPGQQPSNPILTHPIVLPLPPQEGDRPVISHPIVIPPNIIIVPPNPSENKPPPESGGWGYSTDYGWGFFPGPGQAGPKGQQPPAPQQQQKK